MDNLTEIVCLIDDFCREFEPAFEQQLLTDGQVSDLCEGLFGQLFADKGYVARWLTQDLADQGIQFITKLKKNMKPVPPYRLRKSHPASSFPD